MNSFICLEMLFIPESKQSGYTSVTHQVHASPIPSISPVRTSQRNKLLPPKTDYSISPVPGLNINLNSVYQLSHLIIVLLILGFIISIVGRTVKLIII
jgi:cytoskeletal protein RodZ